MFQVIRQVAIGISPDARFSLASICSLRRRRSSIFYLGARLGEACLQTVIPRQRRLGYSPR